MKKVLIIGFLHPFTRSGGSFRTLPLAENLPEFGWEPTVLTPFLLEKPELPFRIIETPYRDMLAFWKRLFGFELDKDIKRQVRERIGTGFKNPLMDFVFVRAGEIVNYPDLHKGWKPFALEAGNGILREEQIDAIISCHPLISHIAAADLKMKYGIPWLADLTDLWSQNHNYAYGPVRKLFDKRLEKRTLSGADALITVSEPGAEKLGILHRGRPIYTITHGFSEEEVNIPPAKLTAEFTITYTGTIYPRRQVPAKLLAALQDLISDGIVNPSEVKVRFYGSRHDWLEKEIERYGLSDLVKQHGRIPREVALERQRESQLLLLLKWEGSGERGVYTGKIFEYLAARRPILATGGSDDVVSRLLDETRAGVSASTVEDIRSTLEALYKEYEQKSEVEYRGEESEVDKYSHREMAKKFSEILDQLT